MGLVDYSTNNRIGYITLNRPEKRNALNQEVVAALTDAFMKAGADDEAKVVVLRARGEAFCAGADLAYLQQLQKFSYEENLKDSTSLMSLFQLIYTLPKVVIAQVQGSALAGGSGLVTVCDFAFSVPDAKFGYTEVRIGFIPAIVMIFLLRKVGEMKAKSLLLTGRLISASEAMETGIISKVVDPETIETNVNAFAQQLVTGASAQSLATTKKLIGQVQSMSMTDALHLAAAENAKARATEDCKKGIDAFLNKQELKW